MLLLLLYHVAMSPALGRSSERVQLKCFFNNTKLNFGPGSYRVLLSSAAWVLPGPSEPFWEFSFKTTKQQCSYFIWSCTNVPCSCQGNVLYLDNIRIENQYLNISLIWWVERYLHNKELQGVGSWGLGPVLVCGGSALVEEIRTKTVSMTQMLRVCN